MSGPRSRLRSVSVLPLFDLAATCAPAAWVGDRSPRHAWIDGHYVAVEQVARGVAWRAVRQPEPGTLEFAGEGSDEDDVAWCRRVLRIDAEVPAFADPVIQHLATRMPGLRPLSDGSLFDGILTGIIGQSISLASAAAAQWKLAASFGEGVTLLGRQFIPLPNAEALAETSVALIRESGVTWKRAEGIHHIAREAVAGNLPTREAAERDPDGAIRDLMRLPMVGRWTAESVLLWGIGLTDCYPPGDVALLRAARRAFAQPDLTMRDPDGAIRDLMRLPMVGRWTAESVLLWGIGVTDCYPPGDVALLRAARRAYAQPDLTMRDLDALSERWRPGRAIAARLLWTDLLGTAR